jgi:hypothetical protein
VTPPAVRAWTGALLSSATVGGLAAGGMLWLAGWLTSIVVRPSLAPTSYLCRANVKTMSGANQEPSVPGGRAVRNRATRMPGQHEILASGGWATTPCDYPAEPNKALLGCFPGGLDVSALFV